MCIFLMFYGLNCVDCDGFVIFLSIFDNCNNLCMFRTNTLFRCRNADSFKRIAFICMLWVFIENNVLYFCILCWEICMVWVCLNLLWVVYLMVCFWLCVYVESRVSLCLRRCRSELYLCFEKFLWNNLLCDLMFFVLLIVCLFWDFLFFFDVWCIKLLRWCWKFCIIFDRSVSV